MTEPNAEREPAWPGPLVAVTLLLLATGAARAEPALAWRGSGDPLYGVPAVSDAELRALRGGMTVMGIEFSFGAIQTVLVDGTPVAQTVFTLADDGALSRALEILDPGVAVAFTGGTVPGMDLGSLSNLEGVVVPGEGGGATLALSGIGPGAIVSALLNNASNQNVAQHFDVQFSINNFSDLRAQLGAIREAQRIAGSLSARP